MTLVLETSSSDIHKCPGCGAPCAVDRDSIVAAANAGQRIRIACHKCDHVFTPEQNIASADSNRGSRSAQPHTSTRIGLCGGCGGCFSLQPLDAGNPVLIECPHCAFRMLPDEIARLDARSEMMAMTTAGLAAARPGRRWTRFVVAMLAGGVLLAGVAIFALERFTPDLVRLPLTAAEPASRLAVTDAGFRVAGGDGDAVLVTVSLANLGTAPGAPERLVVKLVDEAGNIILRRPIASREMKLEPGAVRTLVSRMSPPAPVADLLVELTRQTATEQIARGQIARGQIARGQIAREQSPSGQPD